MWATYTFGALTLLSLPAVLLSGDTVVIWSTMEGKRRRVAGLGHFCDLRDRQQSVRSRGRILHLGAKASTAAKPISHSEALIEDVRLTPWDVTEALYEEIEKDTHLRHTMPTVRIDRRKWHRLSHVTFR